MESDGRDDYVQEYPEEYPEVGEEYVDYVAASQVKQEYEEERAGEECLVVDLEENEFGEIVIVGKDGQVLAHREADDKESINDDQLDSIAYDTSRQHDANIEIVYMPDYDSCDVRSVEQEILSEDIVFADSSCDRYEVIDFPADPLRDLSAAPVARGNLERSERDIGSCEPRRSLLRRPAKPPRRHKPPRRDLVVRHLSQPRERRRFEPDGISSVTTIRVTAEPAAQPTLDVQVKREATHRPHKCGYCEQAYREATSLSLHVTQFHKVVPDSCVVS